MPPATTVGATVDRLSAWLQRQVAVEARGARTLADVQRVAVRVRLLQQHRPLDVEVLTVSDADGEQAAEVGFLTPDGSYVGIEEPLVLCDAHDEAEPWPCPEIRTLLEQYRQPTEPEPDRPRGGRDATRLR